MTIQDVDVAVKIAGNTQQAQPVIAIDNTGNPVPPLLQRLEPIILLNMVTEASISNELDLCNYNKLKFYITSFDVTTGATIKIQESVDKINWGTIAPLPTNANLTQVVSIGEETFKYIRVIIDPYVDGTYTITLIGGN